MLTLCFMKSFPYPYLAPLACNYLCHDHQGESWWNNEGPLQEFVDKVRTNALECEDHYIAVALYVRVQHLDAVDVVNKFAHTSIVLYNAPNPNTKKEFWNALQATQRALQWMRDNDVAPHLCHKLEIWIWQALPTYWRMYAKCVLGKFFRTWAVSAYEKYYAPDYIWKQGPKKGCTTVQWLSKKFHSTYNDHTDIVCH